MVVKSTKNWQREFPWRRSTRRAIAPVISGVLGTAMIALSVMMPRAIAQASDLCPAPVLSRLSNHTVQSGETIDSIAATYDLLPITLLAMNPATATALTPGSSLRIPPFNGAEIMVTSGQTWQDLAAAYQSRADVLFEVNGCPETVPGRIFVPGVSWLLDNAAPAASEPAAADTDPLSAYPLAEMGVIVGNYGWQTDANGNELVFSSGISLEASRDIAVQAAGSGTVAYVGDAGSPGILIVINHNQGLQTRYVGITAPVIDVGDRVSAGQAIATAAPKTADTSRLYFEVRTNTSLGWVARDPGNYIPELAVR